MILVVSNDGRIGRHVRSVLGSQGWFVTTAEDREAALRASADHEPGLVIVDFEVDGASELVRTFGSRNGGPGVLLLEPAEGAEDAFGAFEAGADQILSKPPRAQELLDAAERVMSLPHHSTGPITPMMGEKLGSEEIFGDLLSEMGELPASELEADPAPAPEPEAEPEAEAPPPGLESAAAQAGSQETEEAPPPFDEDLAEEVPSAVTAALAELDSLVGDGEPESASGVAFEESLEIADSSADEPETAAELAGSEAYEPTEESIEEPAEKPKAEELAAEPDELPDAQLAHQPEDPIEALVRTLSPELSVEAGAADAEAEPVGSSAEVASELSEDAESEDLKGGDDEVSAAVSPVAPAAALSDEAIPEEEPSAVGASAGVEPAGPEADAPDPARGDTDGGGVRFGQYKLDERIAVGGMAEVWRASMLGMEGFRKTVAIKKILPHLAENSEFVAMFIEEAKLAAQLSHENLVEIYDLGKIGSSFFIAMEYVDGRDLRSLLNRLRQRSEQMPIGLALLIGAQLARGLEYAHTRQDSQGAPMGLVHRDVSPRNVLLGRDGRVRLCDFGVAKAVSSVIQTEIGALKGKLQYMSPEQASGKAVDARSDIYSLGSVMYEIIAGRRLYEADNEISLLDAVRAGNFDDPRKHCPGLPQEIRRILVKTLAKKPSVRYQSAGELESDLRALLRTLDASPSEQTLSEFFTDLFAEPADVPAVEDVASTISTAEQEPVSAGTRTLTTAVRLPRTKTARFWWGVMAGLLAAGLVASAIKLLIG